MYRLICTERTDAGLTYRSYGICTAYAAIPDISCDRAAVQRLVDLCNRGRLSPAQLHDVVEDFLA